MKIFYWDPSLFNGQYDYYDGIVNTLDKDRLLICRGWVDNIDRIFENHGFYPDLIILGYGFFNFRFFDVIPQIKSRNTACLLFKPQNDLVEKISFCEKNDIKHIFTPVPYIVENFPKQERITQLPYGIDENVFKNLRIDRNIDVGFTGALHESKHYPQGAFKNDNIRTKIGTILDRLSGQQKFNLFWKSSDKEQARIPSYSEYCKTLNSSKIWIATSAAFGDITPRYFEVAASGALLMCEEVPNSYKHIFRDGENCVTFRNDLQDFEEKILFYTSRENETHLRRITDQATEEFKSMHTWKCRANQILDIMKNS